MTPRPLQALAETLHVPFIEERAAVREWIALRRDPLLRGEGVPHGSGEPVVVVGGFGATDTFMGPLRSWLERIGYAPTLACHARGLDCGERSAGRLERTVECVADETGDRPRLLAHSRGGQFARVTAFRRPDLVGGLVTLGTPFEHFGLATPVRIQAAALGIAGTLGAPNLVRFGCLRGACCVGFRRDLVQPLDPGVPFTSIYSSEDRTVRWRTCIDAGARNVDIGGTHGSMLASAASYRAIAAALHDTRREAPDAQRNSDAIHERALTD